MPERSQITPRRAVRLGGAIAAGGLTLALCLAVPVGAAGGVMAEIADAPAVLTEPTVIDGAVDGVTGALVAGDGADVYRICVGDDGFLASTDNASRTFDTKLHLFDAAGNGVWANDDHIDATGRRSRGSMIADPALPRGTYYLAVTHSRQYSVNAAGTPLFDGWFGEQTPAAAGRGSHDHWGYAWTLPGGAYRIDLQGVDGCEPPVIEVGVDVRPGSGTNPLNVRSRGVVPVAVLGSGEFDVTLIDVDSVRVGPGSAGPAHGSHLEDVNGDGRTDLLVHVPMTGLGVVAGDTELCVLGQTTDGGDIHGCDTVTVR